MRTHFVTMILTLTKLGTFSKAMWTKRNQKLHDPTKTPSHQHPILMRILPTTMPTLKIFSQLTASYLTALSRRSTALNDRTKQDGSTAYAASIDTFLQRA